MNKSEVNVGDIVCFKWSYLAGLVERTGKVTQISKNIVEVYTETPSSYGWTSVPYNNIISINGVRV